MPPAPGELWTIPKVGRGLDTVLVAAVYGAHVLVWPVTSERLPANEPCFYLSNGNGRLVVWPEAEVGVRVTLLQTRVDAPVTEVEVTAVHVALVNSDPLPAHFDYANTQPDPAAVDALNAVCELAGELTRR